MEASDQAKTAVKLLGLAQEKKPLTQKEFLAVWNYLLETTLYENASRPGPLEKAILPHVRQATYSASNNRYTILVDKDKTTWHQLMVTSRLYLYLQIYVLFVWLEFAAPGKDALFWPGTIGKHVSEFFSLVGIRKDVRVTTTNIRNMVSDKAYEMSPTKKRLTHHHMKHQERTADANYVIELNADRASRAHKLVSDIIQESGESQPKHQAFSPKSSTNDDDMPLGVVFAGTTASPSQTPQEPLSALSDEQKSVLLTVFHTEISSRKLLTMHKIRTVMRGTYVRRNYVVQPDRVKRIADFVWYKTNSTCQLQLTKFSGALMM